MGGKWTSFRKMGEETINMIIKKDLVPLDPVYEKSVTDKFKLIGSYSAVQIADGILQSDSVIQE